MTCVLQSDYACSCTSDYFIYDNHDNQQIITVIKIVTHGH